MNNDIGSFLKLIVSFLPFVLFAVLNGKANVKKEVRNRQYLMPVFAVIYSVVFSFIRSILNLVLHSDYCLFIAFFAVVSTTNVCTTLIEDIMNRFTT